MTGGDSSQNWNPRQSVATSPHTRAGGRAGVPSRAGAAGSRRSTAAKSLVGSHATTNTASTGSSSPRGHDRRSSPPYSHSSAPSAVRSRGGVSTAATPAPDNGGSGCGPQDAEFLGSEADDEDARDAVPKSVIERDRVRQILGGVYGTPGAGSGGGQGAGPMESSSLPTEQDDTCDVAAPGIILACQDSGVCDVGMRGITRLPVSLHKFFRAEGGLVAELRLQGNRLTAVPPLELLPALTLLDLSTNMLTAVPPSLGLLRRLRVLDLSRNFLAPDLPQNICDLTALTSLDLSHNSLQCLPLETDRMLRLVELRLDNNELTYLPAGCAGLPSLTALHASHNRLTALPAELGAASCLTGLFVAHNKLTALPPTIGQLRQRLAELQLHSNHLSVLPRELGLLAALTRLTTSSNPLIHPPLEVAKKGVAAVREYLLGGWRGQLEQDDEAERGSEGQADAGGDMAAGDTAAGDAAGVADPSPHRHHQQAQAEAQGPRRPARLALGAACKACMDKEDRIEELGQMLRFSQEKLQRSEKQLDQTRQQLGRQAKELAAQATRAVLDAGERARLQRQLEAAALLPGFRAPAQTGSAAGSGAGGFRGAPGGREEVEAHLRSELRAAMGAAEAARAESEAAERDVRRLRREAEEWQHQFRAERERAEELVLALASERERCQAAVAAATEATHMFTELQPVVVERDTLRKELQAAQGANTEAWKAASVAREGHLSFEATADMLQGRLAAMEAAHARLGDERQWERKQAAAAALEAESRERQLQLEIDRLQADVAAMMAERAVLHDCARPTHDVRSSVKELHVPKGQSAWAPPQYI